MTRFLVGLLAQQLVTVAVSATRPSTGAHGVAVDGWRSAGSFSSPRATAFLTGDQAMTIGSPTGGANGVELWGYNAGIGKWFLIGYLNNGSVIPIVGAAQGFAQEVDVIGVFDRIAVAGTPSVGAATAQLAPIESWG